MPAEPNIYNLSRIGRIQFPNPKERGRVRDQRENTGFRLYQMDQKSQERTRTEEKPRKDQR